MDKLPPQLTQLFEDRRSEKLSDDAFQTAIQTLLSQYSTSRPTDWRKYEMFSDLHYTRNLVHANEHYELMVICWKSGQGSRIHNHAQSHCWMTILHGHMIEEVFKLIGCEQPAYTLSQGECPKVEKVTCRKHKIGDVGYINDSMGLHVMRTCEITDGVSLHLYAPPIRSVRIFEPARDRLTTRTPGFYSVDGKRVDPTERLFYDLANIFEFYPPESDDAIKKVQIVMKEYYQAGKEEWKKYCFFNDSHYTRNLIKKNDQFELVVVCWKSGQSSRIQSHPSQTYMCVLEGLLTEYHYDLIDTSNSCNSILSSSPDPSAKVIHENERPTPTGRLPPGAIRERAEFHRVAGDTSHVHDSVALQSFLVGELSDCVSLHVYAPPQPKEVKIFEPARALVSLRTPGFYSINGVLTNPDRR
jgi:cysteine dioxygenase